MPRARVAVVGGGIGGLIAARAAREALRRRGDGGPVVLLEASDRAGGVIRTERADGFTYECAAEMLLDREPLTRQLADALGLEIVMASPAAKRRYLLHGGRLVALPENPPQAITTPLLSPLGKLRAALEPLLPRGAARPDETVLGFVRRRFGREIADRLVDPLVASIFAGDAAQLAVASAFPRLAQLERAHGSVVRGMIMAARGGPARPRRPKGAPRGPASYVFAGGMESFPRALARDLGDKAVRTRTPVDAVTREAGGFSLGLREGGALQADAVIVASPAHAAATLLGPLAEGLGRALRGIPYVDIAVVSIGYAREAVPHPLDGFGFLCPRREERRLLGAVFTSTLFPDRAPAGMHLLRAMVGGARDPGGPALPDDELIGLVRQDLRAALGVTAPPAFVRIARQRPAIPQYVVGHAQRLATIDAALERIPGLYLTGAAYRGISVQDIVKDATAVAERAVAALAERPAAVSGGREPEAA